MQVPPEIFATADDVGMRAAAVVAHGIAHAAEHGRSFVIGCPSGRSAMTTYAALAGEVERRGLDLSHVVIALMDEYVEKGPDGFRAVGADEPHSCVGFGIREIVEPLSAAAGDGKGIPFENLWFPDVDAPHEYDGRLAAIGGIDVFLLATGSSDGHIALNPASSDRASETRIVALEESTRRDNLSTFPTFTTIDDVPRFGVTVGIRTISELSASVIMVALGDQKSEAVRRIGQASEYDPSWPATVLSECRSPLFLIDRQAAGLLESAS
jgi:glucosamine-6-phosphate deaminase